MFLEQKITGILRGLQPAFRELANFEFEVLENGILKVNLLIEPEACEECVTPEEIMEEILLNEVQQDLPIIQRVKVFKIIVGGKKR